MNNILVPTVKKITGETDTDIANIAKFMSSAAVCLDELTRFSASKKEVTLVGSLKGVKEGLHVTVKDASTLYISSGSIEIAGIIYNSAVQIELAIGIVTDNTLYYLYVDAPSAGTTLTSSKFSLSTTVPVWVDSLAAMYMTGDSTKRLLAKFYQTGHSDTATTVANGDTCQWEPGWGNFYTNSIAFGYSYINTYNSCIRFPGIDLSSGDNLSSAIISLVAIYNGGHASFTIDVFCNDVDNAVAPGNQPQGDALVRTTAKTVHTGVTTAETTYQIDVTAPMQEVVDRGTFVSGNAIQFIFQSPSGAAYWNAYGNSVTAKKPILTFITESIGVVYVAEGRHIEIALDIDNVPNNNDLLQYDAAKTLYQPRSLDASGIVAKSLYDANSILIATADDTPIVLPVAVSTILGRKATGAIDDLSPSEARTVLGLATTDSPEFVTVRLSGLTDDYIPYHVNDATGFANGPTKTNVDSAISLKHAAITLDVNADTLLSLSTQQLGLDTQTANYVFAGPVTGAATVPTFRALVTADLGTTLEPTFNHVHTDQIVEVTAAHGIDVDGWHIKDGGAGVITGGTNTFNITNGTAIFDVAAGATLNIDTSLQNTVGAGVLAWPAAGATLTIPTGGGTLGSAAFTATTAYDASGAATTAVSNHAALITGVHGLVFTAGKTLTLTESLTLNALPVGGLAVATSANTLGSLAVGTTLQILVGGGAATVPVWGTNIPTAVTIGTKYIYRADGTDVPVADGGTGASTFALNGVLYGNAANAIGVTAIGAAGQILRVGASPFVPAWTTAAYPAVATTTGAYMRADGTNFIQSTLILPNTAGKGALVVATDANTWGDLAVGTAGQILRGVGAATVPAWTTATYPATVVKGDILHASDTNVITGLADVATGSYLASGGIGAAPAWATLNQAAVAGLTVASSPEFVTVKLSGLTDGYIPYHVADATGLANSAIFQSGGNVGFNTTDIEAWHNDYNAIEYGGYNAFMWNKTADTLWQLHNAYYSGGATFSRKAAGYASEIVFDGGFQHFDVADTAAINSAITWIRALTIGPTGGLSLNGLTDPGVGNIHMPDESWIGPSSTAGVYFKGGNYGFGTTTPAGKLDIYGTGSQYISLTGTGADTYLNLINQGSGGRTYLIDSGGTGSGVGAGSLGFWDATAGAARMVINSSGNVGIGTTSPEAKLDVVSNDNSITYPLLLQNNYNSETPGWGVGIKLHTALAPSSEPYKWAGVVTRTSGSWGNSNNLGFFVTSSNTDTAPTEKMTLLGNGNVGIGTTGPDGKLHVMTGSAGAVTAYSGSTLTLEESGANNFLSFLSPAGQNQGILFGDADANWRGQVQYYHGDDSMCIYTAATEQVRITSTGNVGIGTTGPGQPLEILKSAAVNTNGIRLSNQNISGYGSTIEWYSRTNDGTNTDKQAASIVVGPDLDWGSAAGFSSSIRFSTINANTFAERVRITSQGNVGIGTVTPRGLLDVDGVVAGAGNVVARFATKTSGGNANITFTDGATYNYGFGTDGATGDFVWKSGLYDSAAGTERMRLTQTGNVGIGFTAPLSGLCVDSLHVGSESAAGANNLLVDGYIGAGVAPSATARINVISTTSWDSCINVVYGANKSSIIQDDTVFRISNTGGGGYTWGNAARNNFPFTVSDAGNVFALGTFHVDGVATLDGGFKSFGAETLKVWTYTKTLIQADIDAVHANFTITAVTVANVRALNMAYVNVSLTPDMVYDYPGAYLGSLIGNNQFYIDSTTSVHVGLGTGAEVGDIISITIIEAIV